MPFGLMIRSFVIGSGICTRGQVSTHSPVSLIISLAQPIQSLAFGPTQPPEHCGLQQSCLPRPKQRETPHRSWQTTFDTYLLIK